MRNHYLVLGVRPDATAAEIKSAYRAQALKHHPDREGSAAQFAQIREAYRTLSEPAARDAYDRQRAAWLREQGALGCAACGTANRIRRDTGAPVCAACKEPLPVPAPAPLSRTREKLIEKTAELAEEAGGVLAAEVGELVVDGLSAGFGRLRERLGLQRRPRSAGR